MSHKTTSEKSFQDLLDDHLLKHIFTRPPHAAFKHPIFSSPFARRISESAFGSFKPKWYKRLTINQRNHFQDILHHVEIGRRGTLRLGKFVNALRKFDPSVTRSEVIDILYDMEMEESEGIDFVKFLFVLAYKDKASENSDSGNNDEKNSPTFVTPRQRLILTSIAYSVLSAHASDVEQYYKQDGKQKSEYPSLKISNLAGLSEKEKESLQKKVNKKLLQKYLLTGSPYMQPVPVAKSIRKKIHGGPKRKPSKTSTQNTSKINGGGDMEGSLELTPEEEKLVREINYGRIPLPHINFPEEVLQQLRTEGYTVENMDYIVEKAEEAKQDFRDQLKEAKMAYAKKNIKPILQEGFLTQENCDEFVKIYQIYLPLQSSVEENNKQIKEWKS